MDEGLPIAYEVLEKGVPVYASDGALLGTVEHVFGAPEEDIFHGIGMRSDSGQRFIAAEQVAALHERGVDLRIDAAAAAALPEPEKAASAWRVREPGVRPSRWKRIVDALSGADPKQRNWTKED
jgi:membrane-bound lytic murein transglycosylase B